MLVALLIASLIATSCPEAPVVLVKRVEVGLTACTECPTGTVIVKVTVNPDGSVKDATLVQASLAPTLNGATLRSARLSLYWPRTVNCEPVEGTYLFREDWLPVVRWKSH